MANKNLNKKIVDAVFWTSIFLLVYLIVGFLLGSSWLSKGLTFDESYNLLKDALSITAAFLAPVAAFVLFSDWRSEHKGKSTLQLISELEGLTFGIKNGLGFYNAKIVKEKAVITGEFSGKADHQNLLWQLIELKRASSKLLVKNNEIDALKALIDNFRELAIKALNDLYFKDYFSYQLEYEKNRITSNDNRKSYFKYIEAFNEKFTKLEKLSEEIDQKVVDAQKSIL